MRTVEPAKTVCSCERPVRVQEPDGLGPRCLMCGLALVVSESKGLERVRSKA